MDDFKRIIKLSSKSSLINNDIKRIVGFMPINSLEIYDKDKIYGLSIYYSQQQKWISYINKLPILYTIKTKHESRSLATLFFNIENNKPFELIMSFNVDRDQDFNFVFSCEESIYIILKDESCINSPIIELPKLSFII